MEEKKVDFENDWDLSNMTPQALARVNVPVKDVKCPDGKHSSGWYVGFQCARCGDVD